MRPVIKGIAYEKKDIYVYHYKDRTNGIVNGKPYPMTEADFKLFKHRPHDAPVVMIKYEAAPGDKEKSKAQAILDYYKQIITHADALCKATDNKIDMYKTGGYATTALKLYTDTVGDFQPEHISWEEAQWIENASTGPLRYAENGYTGEAWSYDFISCYLSIMADPKMHFPIAKGEFRTITAEKFDSATYALTGIYRAKVFRSKNVHTNKLYKFNVLNYYTHIDLNLARQTLGLKVKLICDGKPNHLYYPKESMKSGKDMFGEFVDIVYKCKAAGVPGAKNIAVPLWGKLSTKNDFEVKYNMVKGLGLKPGNSMIPSGFDDSTNTYTARIVKKDAYYEWQEARMKPFILAKGRMKIAKIMQPFIADVVYSHTDSMIVKAPIHVRTGTKLGDLKYEGYAKNFYVKNVVCRSAKEIFVK